MGRIPAISRASPDLPAAPRGGISPDPMAAASAGDLHTALERQGFAVLDAVLPADLIAPLLAECARLEHSHARTTRAGLRDALTRLPESRAVAGHPHLWQIVESLLGPSVFITRAILFDKSPRSNWMVAWHQDLTIAVARRRDVAGFGPWSIKDGIPHVQPPIDVLAAMLSVRVHLDDCGIDAGPLEVLPGSHCGQRWDRAAIESWRQCVAPVPCCTGQGGVVLMRPLLLHASARARRAVPRRVLHLECAARNLPFGLEWHRRWSPADDA